VLKEVYCYLIPRLIDSTDFLESQFPWAGQDDLLTSSSFTYVAFGDQRE